MRARLVLALVLALAAASCGGDGGVFTTTSTTPPGSTTTGGGPTTTGGSTTTGPGGEAGWIRVPHDEAVFGPAGTGPFAVMSGVTVGGPGLVAVGSRFAGGDFGAAAAVWTSSDGVNWSLVAHDPAVFGGWNMEEMLAVAAGPGGLVAVGAQYLSRDWDALVWTSPDGLVWARVPDDPAVFGGPGWQKMNAVTAGGPGWVAVGHDDSGDDWNAAVWTSPDGVTWARVPHDEALFGGMNDQEMHAVAAGGPGLVAVGIDDDDPAAWVSADGLIWQKLPEGGFSSDRQFAGTDKAVRGVAAGPPGLVAVGSIEWVLARTDAVDVDAAVWVSEDGLLWTLISEDAAIFGGPGSQEMRAVAAGGPGWVAVGWDDSGGVASGAVWTSSDGVNWSRVHDPAAFGGPNEQRMNAVASGGPDVVVVGSDKAGPQMSAAVWLGRGIG